MSIERFMGHCHAFAAGCNQVTPNPIGPQKTKCPICGYVVLRSSLSGHKRSLRCETAALRHSMAKRGLVVTNDYTANLLHAAGVLIQKKRTAYTNTGRYTRLGTENWVTKAQGLIGECVRRYSPAINRNRAKVVRDLLDNDSVRVVIELGADPKPFVKEAAARLGVQYWDGDEPAEGVKEEEDT